MLQNTFLFQLPIRGYLSDSPTPYFYRRASAGWAYKQPRPLTGPRLFDSFGNPYFMCAETSFVISNMVTSPLPPKSGFSLSSAKIFRLLAGFWRLLALM